MSLANPTPASSVTALAETNTVYAVLGGQVFSCLISDDRSATSSWNPLPALAVRAVQVSAGVNTTGKFQVWAVDANREIWTWAADQTSWVSGGGTANLLDATSDGSVWRLDNGILYELGADGAWVTFSTPVSFASFAAGAQAWLWGVGADGTVYHYLGSESWESYPSLAQAGIELAAGDDEALWGLLNEIVLGANTGEVKALGWGPIPTPPGLSTAVAITVADEAFRFAVFADGTVYRDLSHSDVWEKISAGPFSKIAAEHAHRFWAVDLQGNVSVYTSADGVSHWQQVPAPGVTALGIAACSAYGQTEDVLAWDSSGNVLQYVNGSWQNIHTVAGGIVTLDNSPGQFRAALSGDGHIEVWRPYFLDGWQTIPAAPSGIVDLTVLADGALYAVANDNTLWLYAGAWIETGVTGITSVDASDQDNVWAISTAGTPCNIAGLSSTEGQVVESKQLGWAAEDAIDEARSTHLWIVQRAANLAGKAADPLGAALQALINPSSPTPFSKALRNGLKDADYVDEYMGEKILGISTWEAHFYDPDKHTNWLGHHAPTALSSGVLRYYSAVSAYVTGDLATAGYQLGLALHYLTDLTQPMHAANFTALASNFPGYHPAVETYVLELQAGVSAPTTFTPSTLGLDPASYLVATARNSKDKYFRALCPSDLAYWGFLTSSQKRTIRDNIGGMLTDAINVTAQFLLAWMNSTKTPPQLSFTSQPALPGALQDSPSIAIFQGTLYCFFQQAGTNNVQYVTSIDAVTWSAPQTVPNTLTNGSPSIAVFGDRLFYAHCGVDGNLWCNSMTDGVWSGDRQLSSGFQLTAPPALVVYGGNLCCLFPGNDGLNSPLLMSTADGVTWEGPIGTGNTYATDALAVAVFNGALYMLCQGPNASGDLLCSSATNPGEANWSPQVTLGTSCMTGRPAVAVFAGRLYCFYQDAGGQGTLQVRSTRDGTTWEGPSTVPLSGASVAGAPGLALFGSTLMILKQQRGTNTLSYTTAAYSEGGVGAGG